MCIRDSLEAAVRAEQPVLDLLAEGAEDLKAAGNVRELRLLAQPGAELAVDSVRLAAEDGADAR